MPVAARSLLTNAAADIGALPANGPRVGRVGVNVAAESAGQIRYGCENTAGDDITLDFSEPDLDLVQPGRIGGREVELNLGMRLQEIADCLGLVRREIVEDDVDLLLRPALRNDLSQDVSTIGVWSTPPASCHRACRAAALRKGPSSQSSDATSGRPRPLPPLASRFATPSTAFLLMSSKEPSRSMPFRCS